MPKRQKFTLTDEEGVSLETAMSKDKRAEVRRKATGVRLLHLGHSAAEVAEMLAVSLPTVYNWVRGWRQGGVEGLARQPKQRIERKADETYCQELEKALDSDPADVGYAFSIWTVERLRDHVEQATGVHLSVSRLRVILRERGYVFRRPKHDLSNLQDRDAKEEVKAILEELKRGRSTTISGFSLWTKQP